MVVPIVFCREPDPANRGHGPARLFSARGGRSLFETKFEEDNVLLFGCETKGLPAELLEAYGEQRVYVPIRPGVRSLNLANVVALGAYTALDRAGVPLPDNDGSYVAHAETAEDVRPADVVQKTEERNA